MDLDGIYEKYNKRNYVYPDPLEFLYNYNDTEDREIVGLIASSLAYGRVSQILKSVSFVLNILGQKPYEFLINSDKKQLTKLLKGFKHRFTSEEEMLSFLLGIRKVIKCYNSLENCFIKGFNDNDKNYIPALNLFVKKIKPNLQKSSLLPDPSKGSASKRLNLFLRWMIRKDNVDPGGWNLPSSKLIYPLDTHIYYFAIRYGFTKRKNADLKTALEITNRFKDICPEDPVKYDFAITRFGIRKDFNWDDLTV